MRPMIEGFRTALRGYRLLIGFLLLNLVIAWLGAAPFRAGVAAVAEHSLLAQRMLLHGFDVPTLAELMARPELGPGWLGAPLRASLCFALASLVLMPGVLQAYAAGGRLPREAFFAACGHHLWRFVRLAALFLLVAGPLAGLLGFVAHFGLEAAGRSTHERLSFQVGLATYLVTFVALTFVRMWFDLAQAHVVVRDQKAVRRSLSAAFRLLSPRLLFVYLVVSLLAGAVLALGLWVFVAVVPAHSLGGAFLVTQVVLLLLLAARFWQRATALAVVAAA